MADFSSLQQKVDALKAKIEQSSISPVYLGSLLDDFITQIKGIDAIEFADLVNSLSGRTASLESYFEKPNGIVPRIERRVYVLEQDSGIHADTLTSHSYKLSTLLDDNDIVNYDSLPADVKTYKEFGGMVKNVATVNAASIAKDGSEDDAMIVYDIVRHRFMLAVAGSDLSDIGAEWKQQPAYGDDNIFWQDKDDEGNPLLRQNGFTFYNNWGGADRFGADSTSGKIPVAGRLYLNTGTNVLYRGTGAAIASTDTWARGYADAVKRLVFDDLWTAAVGTHGSIDHTHMEGGVSKPYYLNKLWLTYEEAVAVYIAGPIDNVNSQYRYMDKKIRTNLPPNIRGKSWGASTDVNFRLDNIIDNSDIEVLNLAMPAGSNNICLAFVTGDFYGTRYFTGSKLREIIGPLDLSKSREGQQGQHFFGLCPLLEYFEGIYLREDLDLGGCPKLKDTAIRYLVQNRNPLSFAYHDVTVTVHTDVYAKLTAHLDTTAAGYATRDTSWDDILDLAASKKITFASA